MPRVDIDVGVEERLGELIKQSFAIAYERGTLSGMAAGLRAWSHTSRGKAQAAVQALVKAGVIAGLVAAGVVSFGIIPAAALIGAAVAFGVGKIWAMAAHSSDVKTILERIKLGEDAVEAASSHPGRDRWNESKPRDLDKATVELAEMFFIKLIGDVNKLKDEVDKVRKAWGVNESWLPTALGGTPAARVWSPERVVGRLLAAEGQILQSGNRSVGGKISAVPAALSSIHHLYPLSAKSGEIKDPVDLAIHRLRRIRYYLRWLTEYLNLVEAAAHEPAENAAGYEKFLTSVATYQVLMEGNHAKCGNVCFRSRVSDIRQIQVASGALPVQAPDVRTARSPMELRDMSTMIGLQASGASAAVGGALGGAQKALAEEAADLVATAVGGLTETGLKAAAESFGAAVGDALSFAVENTYKYWKVARPLKSNVKQILVARRSTDVRVDQKIMELAQDNDIDALTQSFYLVHSHYPKRISDRTTKLKTLCAFLQAQPQGTSPFATCEDASKGFRFLAKVYHQCDKLLVHAIFLRLAFETLDRKIFREGYKWNMKPVLAELTERMGPSDAEQEPDTNAEIIAFRSRLKKTKTKEIDHVAREREQQRQARERDRLAAGTASRSRIQAAQAREQAERMEREKQQRIAGELADLVEEATTFMKGTYLNTKPFEGSRFQSALQPWVHLPKAMTLDEWKQASSIFMRPRSGVTVEVDQALQAYLGHLSAGFATPVPQNPGALKGALRGRAASARALLNKTTQWLNAKKGNEKSSRRPAIRQLHRLVNEEVVTLESLAQDVERTGSQRG